MEKRGFMKKEQLELRLVEGNNLSFQALVRQLDREYVERFGDEALQYRQYNGLEHVEQACLLMEGGQAAACGAFQRLDGETAELKRVFVRPDRRRRGYARQLVEMLELQALFGGYRRMALETGRAMPEAIGLYQKLGYQEAPAWGPFVGDQACICMAKALL